MLILGADTSGSNGSVALVEFGAGSPRTLDLVGLQGGTFSAQLVPQISAVLSKHALRKSQISGFAVASGPGSFTGLRVGLAAIKALGEILGKPIAAVSLFEATARVAGGHGRFLIALDAGRGHIYAGLYQVEPGSAVALDQQLLSLEELRAKVEGDRLVTPSPALVEQFPRAILVAQPQADVIAHLGGEKIGRGEIVAPEILDATYVRASDAEIKRTTGRKP